MDLPVGAGGPATCVLRFEEGKQRLGIAAGISPDAVAQAAKAYRVYYAKHPRGDGEYDMDHSAVIYVMNPEGRFTATFTPDSTADAIAQRLQKLIS